MIDIPATLKQLTIEEKAALCTGSCPWATVKIDRLKVPAMILADGPHGVRKCLNIKSNLSQSLPATCFPTASCLAATWDRDLLYTMGNALAEEAIAQRVDLLLGPGVNMKRSPLGGRNFEYFSEDPYLAGELATGIINGIQEKGVGATIKHFAANSQEFKRYTMSAEIDERTLREIYLPAFETAIKKAKPWAVMSAYNKLNGVPCSEHLELLTRILRYEWKYDGLVVSDWGAVQNLVKAIGAGVDLEMQGPQPVDVHSLVDAVRSGALDETILDQAVSRILSATYKAAETPKLGILNVPSHHDLAGRIASEGMVLLKNNGILPLKNHDRITVIGLSARQPYIQGGGASYVNPTKIAIPREELQRQAPAGTLLTYADGYSWDRKFRQALIDEAVEKAKSAEVAIIFIAPPPLTEAEGYDRTDIDLSRQQVALIKAVAAVQPDTVVVLNNGSPIAMSEWIRDVAAVLEAWMMGQAGGKAIADILYGQVNPSGKLAETFPLKLSDTPAYLNWPGVNNMETDTACYGEGLFIGYRYYDVKEVPVLFPFGHGLSYTTFSYSNPQTTATLFKDTDGIEISVDVTNTGNVVGKEIVQVYVHDQKSGLIRPFKELKGFAKVELQPGETQTVSVPLDYRSFAYYHPAYKRWITEDGYFDILIGASSADIRHRIVVNLQSTLRLCHILDHYSTVREWLEDSRGRAILEPILMKILKQKCAATISCDYKDESIVKNMMNNILDMPLFMVFNYFEGHLPKLPEEMVHYLIAKINE
ncbi:MAG: glycoside hydrolase family 3 C-terminal domain-containing protein [Methanocella sp.]